MKKAALQHFGVCRAAFLSDCKYFDNEEFVLLRTADY